MFISYLVPGYLKGCFCYFRGFYLEISKHRLGKKNKRIMPWRRPLISDGPMHFSDLVAEGPSVKSEDLCFCAPFSAKFELKKLRMLACDIFVEAFWLGNEQSRYPSRIHGHQ